MKNKKMGGKNKDEKLVFGMYIRKSSDSEDKQVRSLEDQHRELKELADRQKLEYVEFPGESRSAHTPGRPIFGRITQALSDGKINALLVWHANRISRNPLDGGMIIYLMDIGQLQTVVTPGRTFNNTPSDKFLLQLEFGMSKKDSDDKSEAVRRGIKGRALRGYPPTSSAKIGFLNDPDGIEGSRGWIVDPINFPLIKKLFALMLEGKYNPRQLWKIARDKLKLMTHQRKKLGGKTLSLSFIYNLLRDPVYAGFFYYEDKRRELDTKLPRAINEQDYWKIQAMLGRKGLPKPKSRPSMYNHFMRCGHCGGAVTIDYKYQLICDCKHKFPYTNREACPSCDKRIDEMAKPVYLSYVYYYCAKKTHPDCKERSIEQRVLESTLLDFYAKNLAISKELSAWTLKYIEELNDKELKEHTDILRARQSAYNDSQKQLDALLSLKLKGMITDEEYLAKKASLVEELSAIKSLMTNKNTQPLDWRKSMGETFSLVAEILEVLQNGTIEEKKTVMSKIGSNLTLKDKKVIISNTNQFKVLINDMMGAREENPSFEPKNIVSTSKENAAFAAILPTWLRR